MARHPVIEPTPDTRESGGILAAIGKAANVVPELPDYLYKAGEQDLLEYTMALFSWLQKNRKHARLLPLIISETRKESTKSPNLDLLWSMLLVSPAVFKENVSRAGIPVPTTLEAFMSLRKIVKALKGIIKYRSVAPLAILSPSIAYAEILYERIIDSRSGLWLGKMDDDNMRHLRTKDTKINLYIPEMVDWMEEIVPDKEANALQPDPNYPLILNAGRHKPENANSLMRNPAWNKGRRTCTLAMHPEDAKALDLQDGQVVKVVTEAAIEQIELEITDEARKGQVLIPHGFGLRYRGEVHGINVNRLTKNTHRDRLAATPLHRYVPCRVEKIKSE